MTFEVVLRWGDDLLDVRYVDTAMHVAGVELDLVDGATGKIGYVDYAITRATRPPRELPFARGDDHRIVRYAGVALVAHLALWGVATQTAPPDLRTFTQTPERPLHVTKSFGDAQATPPDKCDDDKNEDTKAAGSGTAMKLDEGTSGTPHSQRVAGHIAVAKTGTVPQLSRNEALEAARNAGIMGPTAVTNADAFKSLMGSADLASGFDGANINSTLKGGELAAHGTFGLSYQGDAGSGGGTLTGTVGVGDRGFFSNGESDGDGWGNHDVWEIEPGLYLTIDICGRPYEDSCVHFGDTDERVIRRHVRRHTKRLFDCYVKRTRTRRDLPTGPVTVDFAIDRGGKVKDAIAAGLDDKVDACVAGIYKAIKFPRMRDIGMQVRHVLNFSYKRSTSR